MTFKPVALALVSAVLSVSAQAHFIAPACNCPGGEYLQMNYETEKAVLIDIFNQALEEYETEYPGRLGRGWYGNVGVTGPSLGDNCDVVHNRFVEKIRKLINDYVNRNCVRFLRTDVVSLHSLVARFGDVIEFSHVYLAIADIEQSSVNTPVIFFDPWRSRRGWYERNPNSEPESATGWGIQDILPCLPESTNQKEIPWTEDNIGLCLEAGGKATPLLGQYKMLCMCQNSVAVLPDRERCLDAPLLGPTCRKLGGALYPGADGYPICVNRDLSPINFQFDFNFQREFKVDHAPRMQWNLPLR